DHHPDVQKAIDMGMHKAEGEPTIARKAMALHHVIEDARAKLNPNNLWKRLGGGEKNNKVVDDFVAAIAKDDKVNVTRNGKYKLDDDKVAALKKSLVAFMSAATGGPTKYEGKSMKEVHKDMGITDAEFDAAAKHLKDALEKNGAKAD